MVIKLPEIERSNVTERIKKESVVTIPIEDIGIVILDHPQITITQMLLVQLLENNCALISCNSNHMPMGLNLPLESNTLQNERFRQQIEASLPLKKQLWQQTIQQKIANQAAVLKGKRGVEIGNMLAWVGEVRSGDPENIEGKAAAYYWKNLFPSIEKFTRGREGEPPNNMLNYGYAILRAVVARALVASGLLPTLGIHHHNRYNAYCLADDVMEPYRPYVDALVVDMVEENGCHDSIGVEQKQILLQIPCLDVFINKQRSPLEIAVAETTASLYKCFNGASKKICYPIMK